MRELTKDEKRTAKEVIRRGILRRHAEWQNELRQLLDKPFGRDDNEFSRSLEITDKARKFYSEAMRMEGYYSANMLTIGLACLYSDGYLNNKDIAELSEEVQRSVKLILSQ